MAGSLQPPGQGARLRGAFVAPWDTSGGAISSRSCVPERLQHRQQPQLQTGLQHWPGHYPITRLQRVAPTVLLVSTSISAAFCGAAVAANGRLGRRRKKLEAGRVIAFARKELDESDYVQPESYFAGIRLSQAAAKWFLRMQGVYSGEFAPTPIQEAGIRPIFEGDSVALRAPTGTGKTLAYLLPTLERLQQEKYGSLDRPRLLIVTALEDLQLQIASVVSKLLPRSGMHRILSVRDVGSLPNVGTPAVLIGTPTVVARLLDHPIGSKARDWRAKLANLGCIVVDEADSLLPADNFDAITKMKMGSEYRGKSKVWSLLRLLTRISRQRSREDVATDLQIVIASASIDERTIGLMYEATGVLVEPISVGSVAASDDEEPSQDVEADGFIAGGPDAELDDSSKEVQEDEESYDPWDEEEQELNASRLWPKGMRHYIAEMTPLLRDDGTFVPGLIEYPVVPMITSLGASACLVVLCDGTRKRQESERLRACSQTLRQLRTTLRPLGYQVVSLSAAANSVNASPVWQMAGGKVLASSKPLVIVGSSENVRGLDIPNIDVVMILGGAGDAVEYMHMAGRTARCRLGLKTQSGGTVISVVEHDQRVKLRKWVGHLGASLLDVDLDYIIEGSFRKDEAERAEYEGDVEKAREEAAEAILAVQMAKRRRQPRLEQPKLLHVPTHKQGLIAERKETRNSGGRARGGRSRSPAAGKPRGPSRGVARSDHPSEHLADLSQS